MDKRQKLARGSVLAFPGMECHIEETIGWGSNAIVYKGWYQDQLQRQEKHEVLIKELFPLHKKGGIRRGADMRICVEEGEPLAFFLMHRESFEAGNRIHLRLLGECPQELGANLNSFEMNGTLYTVMGFSGGKSLDEELALDEGRAGIRRYALLTKRLLDALSAFHDSGYLHLDISPDNALIVGRQSSERIMLIDYNSARPISGESVSHLSYKEGYSAPEVEMGDDEAICEASDLYSVAAIFYRMLMGRPLTLEEMLYSDAPDAENSPCMQDVPQTVKSMVRIILRRGLAAIPEDRYQSLEQMRRDFDELIDRIDCVGVTHWALWESGRRSVEEFIRANRSLRYVKEEETLYPIRLEQDGQRISLEELVRTMMSAQGVSRLTVSPGGMGKTTLLLRTAMLCGRRYAPSQPAVFYVSLAGFSGSNPHYIRSQILSSLRFKRENNTYDSAMHELEQLLGKTAGSRGAPTVLLLLDGLNEVRGDAAPLMQEINLLGKKAGVRIMAASRTEMPELEMQTNRLLSLTFEDVERAAAAHGVLLPQSEELVRLMRTPLILSIYLKACENSQLLHLRNQDDLMQAYMKALHDKEVQPLAENSPERWQTEAALSFVLPAIAAQAVKTGGRLTDAQVLSAVEECYKVFTSPILKKAFPRWIVHRGDILGGAQTAGDWCKRMVSELLWQRLGLLIRDEEDGFRVFHQTVAEYLCGVDSENQRVIRRFRMIRGGLFGALALIVCLCGFGVYAAYFMVTPYDDEDASFVLAGGRSAYERFFDVYAGLDDLLAVAEKNCEGIAGRQDQAAFAGWVTSVMFHDMAREQDPFERAYISALGALVKPVIGDPKLINETAFDMMKQERKVVSWSSLPLDTMGLIGLQHHLQERENYYRHVFLPQFKTWYYRAFSFAGGVMTGAKEYLSSARRMIENDVMICQLMYDLYVAPHMNEEQLRERITFARVSRDSSDMDRVATKLRTFEQMDETLLDELRRQADVSRGVLEGFGAAHAIAPADVMETRLDEAHAERRNVRIETQRELAEYLPKFEEATKDMTPEEKYRGLLPEERTRELESDYEAELELLEEEAQETGDGPAADALDVPGQIEKTADSVA